MRVLILSKRQYMNKDLIDDRYGRFREIPLVLAKTGHDVQGICLSYRPRKEGWIKDATPNANVPWRLLNADKLLPFRRGNYWKVVNDIGKDFLPDIVWACSDALHAIIGKRIAKKLKATFMIDLYDNFESFTLTRLPGMTALFRRALRNADGITCVSHPLREYVRKTSHCTCPMEVIENAVPEDVFHPMDRAHCRRTMGLPQDGFLIGTAGALSKSRGIETLFKAFEILAEERPDLYLVLAGSRDRRLRLPRHPRVHYLGMLPMEKVPCLLSALNISVICNRESAFGKYCFPQKFYESLACGIPVVAAATGSMLELLANHPQALFEPENPQSLAERLRRQMNTPLSLPISIPTWTQMGLKLAGFFESCLKESKRRKE